MMAAAVNCGGPNQLQLTRTIERVFEDAVTTGELRLNGRKLREFPRIASKYALSDTYVADLSKNRFAELPSEICEYVLLERIDCYHNIIRTIPDSIAYLHCLTTLNLSRNQLATLPPILCQLPILEILIVSHNKLVSLPEEISQMNALMELDASCNEISHLPPQIGSMRSLRSLELRRNMLVELPIEISSLRLVRLDISENRISVLPPQLRHITSLMDLILEHNPLTSPPAHLCTRGRTHVFKYLEIQAIKEDKKRGHLVDSEYRRSHRKINGIDGRLSGLSLDSRRSRYTVDSGYCTSEGGERRWSAEMQEIAEVDASSKLALRAAENTKEQRQERERGLFKAISPDGTISNSSTPSTLSPGSEMNFEDEVSKELMEQHFRFDECRKMGDGAGRSRDEDLRDERTRVSRKIDQQKEEARRKTETRSPPLLFLPVEALNNGLSEALTSEDFSRSPILDNRRPYTAHTQTYREYKEALRLQRCNESSNVYRRHVSNGSLSSPSPDLPSKAELANYPRPTPTGAPGTNHWSPEEELQLKHEAIMQQQRYESQLAQYRLEEEKRKQKQIQKEAVLSYVKSRTSPLRMMEGGDLANEYNGGRSQLTSSPINGVYTVPKSSEECNPNFTMRREWEKAKEEKEHLDNLRQSIESRLKVALPHDLPAALTDGVVLCHLANHVRPRSVSSIHVPSPAVPKLTLAKCRRNIECFLDACRRIGVQEDYMCLPADLIEERSLVRVATTVQALLAFVTVTNGPKHPT